jgi:pentose-5-phosphate-3-epimerase
MGWREWIRTVEIVPVLSMADQPRLGSQVDSLLRAGCRVFHLDVDEDRASLEVAGLVVPLLERYGGVLDVQLEGAPDAEVLAAVAEAGASSLTFSLDSVDDLESALGEARELGLQAGVALARGVDPDQVGLRIAGADIVRCPPGTTEDQAGLAQELKRYLPSGVPVETGHVTFDSVRVLFDAGSRLLLAGDAIFGYEDLPRNYHRLVRALA